MCFVYIERERYYEYARALIDRRLYNRLFFLLFFTTFTVTGEYIFVCSYHNTRWNLSGGSFENGTSGKRGFHFSISGTMIRARKWIPFGGTYTWQRR